jgi:predicted alpha/beta hydrolase
MDDPYRQEFVDLPGPPSGRAVPYRLGLYVYRDPGPAAPVVVLWPAMGAPARFYRPFAQRLGESGVAVVVADLRGTGTSTPTPSRADRYGYLDLADDVGTVLDFLAPRLAGRRHYLLGHSLGGQVCALHLAQSKDRDGLAGLLLIAVGLPYFRSYPPGRRLGILPVTQSIAAATALLRVWPGWGFGGRASRGVISDWGYTARHGHFRPRWGVDLGRVRTPVLAVSVERDRLTPRQALDHLCGQLAGAPIERVHLAGDLDHFSWVRNPDAVARHVVAFVS